MTLQDAAPSGNLFRFPFPSDLTAEGTCFGHALETYLTRLNEYIAVLQNYRDHVLQTREAYTDAKTVSPSERSIPMLDRVSTVSGYTILNSQTGRRTIKLKKIPSRKKAES